MAVPTPHNSASRGDFAPVVLMPGDPLRSQFIAEHYLEQARLVNPVRGINGYTGMYQGVPVSVMASGMGMPSMGIYAHELFQDYDVQSIIRIGSAGGLHPDLKLRDVVAGIGACTNSAFAQQFPFQGHFAPVADFGLLRSAVEQAEQMGVPMTVGNLYSSDTFYSEQDYADGWRKMNVLAVEMEAAALYITAAVLGKKALAICTISDIFATGEACTAQERQDSFTVMMEIALRTAILPENRGEK